MWTEDQLAQGLEDLGLPRGAALLAHVSTRAVGEIEGGPAAVLEAIRRAIGPEGTLIVPAFTPQFLDPAEGECAPESAEEIERAREQIGRFDTAATPADETAVGGPFAELVRRLPDARRSDHPVYSFAAVGPLAERITANAPFHYPFGSDSPLAHLYSQDGWVVLVGAGQQDNPALRLAEIWADAPYIHRTARVKAPDGKWVQMQGAAGCSEGFTRIDPVLRQARILRRGRVGDAQASLMRIRETVSMAVAMLQGSGSALLCDDPECPDCSIARKLTAKSTFIEGQSA